MGAQRQRRCIGLDVHREFAQVAIWQAGVVTQAGRFATTPEGVRAFAETLTVLRLGVPPTLARTLRSTNTIESMISICRDHAGNVKRWQDGQMALRWCAAGMVEAAKQFRRVNGYLHLPALRAALEAEVANTGTAPCKDQEVEAA